MNADGLQCPSCGAANRTGRAKISITGPNSALTVGRFGNHVRFSVSVYNNQQDVDKILEVLS